MERPKRLGCYEGISQEMWYHIESLYEYADWLESERERLEGEDWMDLLPCPFCGSDDVAQDIYAVAWTACGKCRAAAPTAWWQQRTQPKIYIPEGEDLWTKFTDRKEWREKMAGITVDCNDDLLTKSELEKRVEKLEKWALSIDEVFTIISSALDEANSAIMGSVELEEE